VAGARLLAISVNPTFEPNHTQAGRENAEITLLFPLHEDNPQRARVKANQQLLFPANPAVVCQELGLNWWAALKLHEDGWLSFPPDRTPQLDEAQETELRFVGSLVIAGCDHNMLASLLNELPKPYSYDPQKLFYDWSLRRWRALPEPDANPEAVFADWLEELVESSDVGTLAGIDELAHDALARVSIERQTVQSHPSLFQDPRLTGDSGQPEN
jgi:hypothetical protein